MQTQYFNLKDSQIVQTVVKTAFPDCNKRQIVVTWGMKNMNLASWWDEGRITHYALVNLANMEVRHIPTAHPMFEAANYAKYKSVDVPEGFVVVAWSRYGSHNTFYVYAPVDAPLLAESEEVSDDMIKLLIITASRKSSYAGYSDYRAYELKDRFKWSQEKTDAMRQEAIANGYMTNGKAITTKGRNVIANHPKRYHY